ncbi:hypothetical protein JXR93_06235 [bacterium]|nr:hypothetical protein [bacterium]
MNLSKINQKKMSNRVSIKKQNGDRKKTAIKIIMLLSLLLIFSSCTTKQEKKTVIIDTPKESINIELNSKNSISITILNSDDKHIVHIEAIYSEKKPKQQIDFGFDSPLIFSSLNSEDRIFCELKSKAILTSGGVSFICSVKESDIYTLAKSKNPIKIEYIFLKNKKRNSNIGIIDTKEIIKFKKFLKSINPDYPI